MATLVASLVLVTAVLCGLAVWFLRYQASSPTARVIAGLFAGYGAWLLTSLWLQSRGWPLIVLAILLALLPVLRGRHHVPHSH